jgi:hypothetical protein
MVRVRRETDVAMRSEELSRVIKTAAEQSTPVRVIRRKTVPWLTR